MAALRIALVSQEYPPQTAHGGIGSQTYMKAHGLASLGHEVHVISHSTDEATHQYMDGPVHVTRIPGADARLPICTDEVRWLTYSVEVAAAVARLLTAKPLDIVDFPEWGGEGYIHLLNRAGDRRIPTVIHLHGPVVMFAHAMGWPDRDSEFYRTASVMEGTSVRLADAVFSSSRCSAEWCAKHYGIDVSQVPILHTGVDTGLFHPIQIEKEARPTILFIGKVAANKGVEPLLQAACRLSKDFPSLHLKILGRGDEKLMQKLRDTAAASGHKDLLEMPGFVQREQLPAHLCRAHVFAAPSVYEGGPGFVYLEAMACGLPVIACSGSGAAEVVTHGETGLLVPPDEVETLTASLRRLLADAELREKMGRAALDYVRREADSAVCLRRLEAFYAAVSARAKSSNNAL